jgi:hypothetical protein
VATVAIGLAPGLLLAAAERAAMALAGVAQ